MSDKKEGIRYTTRVSDSFEKLDEDYTYELPFRRWLVREIEEGKISAKDAVTRFELHPSNGLKLIAKWRKRYAPELLLSSCTMTLEEQQEVSKLTEQLSKVTRELEDSRLLNITMHTLVDIADEMFKIDIRKKLGAKQ